MKKNVMMRVASALLVAVLMTTCAISGTFAKYTTTATGSDTARVAKWGFTQNTIEINMFDGNYTNVQAIDSDSDGEIDNVVAPGTSKTATIDFTPANGTPEVAYTFKVTVEAVTTGDGTQGALLLSKLVWTVNGNEVGEFANVQAEVDSYYTGTFAAGSEPSDLTIGWKWAIDGDDATDTALGNATNLATVTINVSFEATQQ